MLGLNTDLTIYRASPAEAATAYARDRSLSQHERGWDTTDISGVGNAAFVATSAESMGLTARARRGNAYVVAQLLLTADDLRLPGAAPSAGFRADPTPGRWQRDRCNRGTRR
jgi:hypothetical protein